MTNYGKLKVPLKKKGKKKLIDLEIDSYSKKGSSIKWCNHVVDTFIAIHRDMQEEFITKRKACI
jgi:hypothetical protein